LRAISLELEEATDARGEVSMLNSLAQLADAQRLKGDYENSKRSFIRCLEAQENLLGPDHPSTLVTANNLALMFHDKGDYERAEAFYKRCLEGQERRSRSENPAALITVDNLGTLYWDRGDLEQAELCLKRCLEARERLIGPEHPDTNSTLFSLANLLTDQRRFVEAIPLRRRELNWRRQRNGEMDVHTLWSINRLAIDLREAGELQEAEGLFRDLLVARQALLEPEDFEIGRALGGLAKTLIAESKLEEALDYSRQALNHRLFYEGPDTWWTNLERLDLAKILHKLDRSSEALQQLDALQTSIESLESPDDDDRQLLDDALSLRKAIETGP
jgi:tetratricopeptide (TPR) repeat protein